MNDSSRLHRRYIFWQPIPSMHQMPFLEHLHDFVDAEVVCVYADAVPSDRLALGWSHPLASNVRLISAADVTSADLIKGNDVDSLHCFSGMHCHPYVSARFRQAIAYNTPVALISEAHDGHGIRGSLRKLRSLLDSRRYSSRLAMVLAMGRLGVDWYRGAGFRPETLFPFAYVAEPRRLPTTANGAVTSPFTIAYVGQLIHRKGVDLLFNALASLMHMPWRLEVAGVGPLEQALRATAKAAGFSDRIAWRGSLPNQQVSAMLGDSDLLVLPSRFDGWGVVVNEALGVGTPVVCSDACGAADLVSLPVMGRVVPARSVAHLAKAIGEQIRAAGASSARGTIREYANQFSPLRIAKYFVDIVGSVWHRTEAPSVPWRSSGASW